MYYVFKCGLQLDTSSAPGMMIYFYEIYFYALYFYRIYRRWRINIDTFNLLCRSVVIYLYQFSKHSTNLSILRYTPKSRRIIRPNKVKISPYFYKSLVEGACSAFVRSLYLWYEMSTDQKYFCSRCCYFFHRWVNINWYLCYVRIDAKNVKI